MPTRFWTLVWALAAIAGTALALTAANAAPEEDWRFALAAVMALITLAGVLPSPLKAWLARPLRLLRRRPWLYWLLLLVILYKGVGAWLVAYQPTNGRLLQPVEFAYLAFVMWLLIYLLVYDLNRERGAELTASLGRSRATGILITLTTFLILFFGAEAYLRIFYITTDAYGFTAMNYHWYKNFLWSSQNSLGYRDAEPQPAEVTGLTRIAIVGDSFAVGHGINDIGQTFGQLLERDLGGTADVMIVAASGLDSDVEVSRLDSYPIRPDIVVLSYYLNDIDYLMTGTELDPDANFDFIQDENLHWFVLNYFVPNYIYYNLMQFTSPVRARSFIADLIDAHLNDELWTRHVGSLDSMVQWAQGHDARLIVLLWPHLAAIEQSRPATERVRAFFESAGVQVIDMADLLAGRNTAELIVNRFDTHPGVLAHQIAAAALLEAIQGSITPDAESPAQDGG